MKRKKFLLLDSNYLAISVLSWRRAVKLISVEKAEPVETEGEPVKIRCVNGYFSIPSVLRLKNKIPWRSIGYQFKFNRRSMLIRDNYACQYCGKKVGKNASIDHILPKSRGGKTNFINCVTCCRDCNNWKDNKTPKEAGMRLIKKPKNPTFWSFYRHRMKCPKEWAAFIVGAKNED